MLSTARSKSFIIPVSYFNASGRAWHALMMMPSASKEHRLAGKQYTVMTETHDAPRNSWQEECTVAYGKQKPDVG